MMLFLRDHCIFTDNADFINIYFLMKKNFFMGQIFIDDPNFSIMRWSKIFPRKLHGERLLTVSTLMKIISIVWFYKRKQFWWVPYWINNIPHQWWRTLVGDRLRKINISHHVVFPLNFYLCVSTNWPFYEDKQCCSRNI